MINCPEAGEWERHWAQLTDSLKGRLFSLYRRQVRSRSVARTLQRLFPTSGVFAECGCGSGETGSRLHTRTGQTCLAVDFSWHALRQALNQPCLAGGVQADIRDLPFRDDSLDGIWNLGVMEHFELDEQRVILREFRRVLKPGAFVALWWPPPWGLDYLLLRPFGDLFPGEPGRVSRATARSQLESAGFRNVSVSVAPSDAFTELLVTGTA
jgi:SAM-dependent methyltransferase